MTSGCFELNPKQVEQARWCVVENCPFNPIIGLKGGHKHIKDTVILEGWAAGVQWALAQSETSVALCPGITDIPPSDIAAHLLLEYVRTGEEYLLANADPDDLRRALMLAAPKLRALNNSVLARGARRLVAEVWLLVTEHKLNARSPAADAALDLRDTINPAWWPDVHQERPDAHGGH